MSESLPLWYVWDPHKYEWFCQRGNYLGYKTVKKPAGAPPYPTIPKYRVGDRVRFEWGRGLVKTGVVVEIRHVSPNSWEDRKPEDMVNYTVRCIGHDHWVDEKMILGGA